MKNVNAIILVLLTAVAAQANAQNSPAKDLFAGKCAVCHAADGSASTSVGKSLKIPNLHSADVQKQSDVDLKAMIAKGKGAMPTFAGKLSDGQIDLMVVYIRALGKK
jgi:mono/diheme cytochrome c family protein